MKSLNYFLNEAKSKEDYQDIIDDTEAAIWSIDNEVKSWIPKDSARK